MIAKESGRNALVREYSSSAMLRRNSGHLPHRCPLLLRYLIIQPAGRSLPAVTSRCWTESITDFRFILILTLGFVFCVSSRPCGCLTFFSFVSHYIFIRCITIWLRKPRSRRKFDQTFQRMKNKEKKEKICIFVIFHFIACFVCGIWDCKTVESQGLWSSKCLHKITKWLNPSSR